MTKTKGYFFDIPRFYRWQTFDYLCFGYVNGLRTAVPSMTTVASITRFLSDFDLCEDQYCWETARMSYQRIRVSYKEMEMGLAPEVSNSRIARFYLHQAYNHIAYGYILGVRSAFPTVSITGTIAQFVEAFDLSDETYNAEYAYKSFELLENSLKVIKH